MPMTAKIHASMRTPGRKITATSKTVADLVASESIFWDRGHQIPNSALAFPVRIDSTCAGLSFTASVA